MADQKLLLTDIQFAYLVGRDSNMYLGGNATHGYMELEGNADPDRIEDALYKVMKRHEALRIVVGEDGTQTFKESFDKYHINRFDLTKMSDDEKITLFRVIVMRILIRFMSAVLSLCLE